MFLQLMSQHVNWVMFKLKSPNIFFFYNQCVLEKKKKEKKEIFYGLITSSVADYKALKYPQSMMLPPSCFAFKMRFKC